MAATPFDLPLEAGATYSQSFAIVDESGDPFPIDDYTFTWQIRPSFLSSGAPLLSGSVTPEAGSVIVVEILSTDTATLPRSAVWGLEMAHVSGEPVIRLLQGRVRISPEVVKWTPST